MTSVNTSWGNAITTQKELCKRRLWPIALSILCFLIYYVIGTTLLYSSIGHSYTESPDRVEALLTRALLVFSSNPVHFILVAGLALVLSLQGFAWMHSRREVDFYESQPVGRTRRFVDLCLNSFLIFLVPLLVMTAFAALISLGVGILIPEVTEALLWQLLRGIGLFLAVYFIGVFAATLTGNPLISVLAAAVLLCYEWMLRLILYLYQNEYWNNVIPEETIDAVFSPVYHYFRDERGLGLLFLLVIALIAAALAYLCYRLRKNESAGRAVVFRPVQAVVKIAIAVLVGLVVAFILEETTGSLTAMILSSFFVVVAACIMQIIYDFDFKALFRHGWEIGAAVVLSLLAFAFFRYDALGVNRWVPEPASIEYAAIYFPGPQSYDRVDSEGNGSNIVEYAQKYMRLTDGEAIVKLAETGLGWMADEYNEYDGEIYDGGMKEYRVEYHLTNGSTQKRRYTLPTDLVSEELDRILASEEFKSGYFQVYHDEAIAANPTAYTVRYSNGALTSADRLLTPDLYQSLREAYLKDLAGYNYTLARTECPIGSVVFYGPGAPLYYSVYSTFANTLAFLKNENLFLEKIDFAKLLQESSVESNTEEYEEYSYPLLYNTINDSYALDGLFRYIEQDIDEYISSH